MKRMMDEWDWKFAGGSWPTIDNTVEEINSKGHQSTVDRPKHTMITPPRWRWKRIYKEDGNIEYDLVDPDEVEVTREVISTLEDTYNKFESGENGYRLEESEDD